MINLQCRIFTSEIDIIEWDWNKFQPHLFINNCYNSCTSVSIWVSPFPKKFKVSNTRAFSLTPWFISSAQLDSWTTMDQNWPKGPTFYPCIHIVCWPCWWCWWWSAIKSFVCRHTIWTQLSTFVSVHVVSHHECRLAVSMQAWGRLVL